MRLAEIPLLAVVVAVSSPAGVVLKGRITELEEKKTSEMVMYVDASRLRVDTRAGGADMSMILLVAGDDYQLIMLNRKENQYQVMDRKTAAQIDEAVSAAMAQMEAQLKQLPPEQRAMVEKMMGQKLGGAAKPAEPPALSYRAAGTGTAGDRPCKKYEVFQGQEKVSELCAVPPAALGLTADEMALFDKAAAAMEDMTRGVRRYFDVGSIKGAISVRQIDGFPVEQVIFREGKPSARMQIYAAEQRALTDADFSTGDAKRMEMPRMSGAR